MNRFNLFLKKLNSYADLPCMDSGDRTFSYGDLLKEFATWQGRLEQLNIQPGSVVGLRADYSLASTAALLALFARGSVAALIPRDRDPAPYLQDGGANGLLEVHNDGTYQWQALLVSGAQHELLERLRTSGDAGVVIFTSGSTGKPKAALQSLERFLYKFQGQGRRFRTLGFLLFDHVAGLDTLFYTLSSGGVLVVTRKRDPAAICALIHRARVEVLPASPSFLRLLCLAGSAGDYDLSSLKVITYGSEPMDPATLMRLNERFPQLQISQKYGTTETGSPRSESRGKDSLWLKLKNDGVETRVVDNVLWIRSEGTILGYLNAPSPVDAEGWYCTGDLVDVDGEWIKFRGRVSDVINVGGEKVAPSEVEQVILSVDNVQEAVVSGERHALMGQIVTARVALVEGADSKQAAKAIRARCRERLAPYKVPVKIEFVPGGLINDRQKAQRMIGS
ncbi:MAG: fatty acid--CoA ligase family protein [Steroidobacteraceae bacterium]